MFTRTFVCQRCVTRTCRAGAVLTCVYLVSVVLECTLLVFTDLFETLIQTFMAVFTLLILHLTTLTTPECGITLDLLVVARFGLTGLGLQGKSHSHELIFGSERALWCV